MCEVSGESIRRSVRPTVAAPGPGAAVAELVVARVTPDAGSLHAAIMASAPAAPRDTKLEQFMTSFDVRAGKNVSMCTAIAPETVLGALHQPTDHWQDHTVDSSRFDESIL